MNKYHKDWIYFDRKQEQTTMVKSCKTCKHGISMDKVCKNCKHGNWGAELPKVCSSCKEGEFWEPKEVMDIWKEAPEGAEYYNLNLKRYYYVAALSVFYWMGAERRWGKSVAVSLVAL